MIKHPGSRGSLPSFFQAASKAKKPSQRSKRREKEVFSLVASQLRLETRLMIKKGVFSLSILKIVSLLVYKKGLQEKLWFPIPSLAPSPPPPPPPSTYLRMLSVYFQIDLHLKKKTIKE